MADILRELYPPEAQYRTGTAFPQFLREDGTNAPVTWLAYDAAATEYAYWELGALNYGGSSPAITVDITWGAASATSGVCRWGVSLLAVTPETDTGALTSEAFGTEVVVDDTHLGTSAKRLMLATLSLTSGALDSVVNKDELVLRVGRIGGHANDTMAGDALFKKVLLTWADS